MKALLISWVVLVGMLLPVQSGMNAELKRQTGHALWAGITNFSLGLALIAMALLALQVSLPSADRVGTIPWWAWLGGICGAALVVTSAVAAPRLGALLLVVCLLVGQLSSSVVLDHFGWIGYPQRPLTLERALGVLLLFVSLYLLDRGT